MGIYTLLLMYHGILPLLKVFATQTRWEFGKSKTCQEFKKSGGCQIHFVWYSFILHCKFLCVDNISATQLHFQHPEIESQPVVLYDLVPTSFLFTLHYTL